MKLLETSNYALVAPGHGNTSVQNSKTHSVVQSDQSFMEVVREEKKQEEVVQIRQALVNGKGKSEAEETVVLPTDLKNQRQSQINKIASMERLVINHSQ